MRGIIYKKPEEIEKIARAGRILSECLDLLEEASNPGISTEVLDRGAEGFIRDAGALPAFKGYKGYPASICASVNDVVVHGIPGPEAIKSGDILSLDVGVSFEGWIADAAITVAVGEASERALDLIRFSQRALVEGTKAAKAGGRVGDISAAIERVAEENNLSIASDFVGHGLGQSLHEDPEVPNIGVPGEGPELREGMVVAIEPMFCYGSGETKVDRDGWTYRTRDGGLAAHSEFTVAITKEGPRVLTPWLGKRNI